jgi:hypothetical protein
MSAFTEITEALQATCAAGPVLRSRMERARTSATTLADRADSHGWAGVAASMRGAVEALGTAEQELGEFQKAGEAAITQLELIDDQGSVTRVSTHLAAAEHELSAAVPKLDTATGLLDDALQACARAGQRGLPASLSALREDVIANRRQLEQSRLACESERQTAEDWLRENPDQVPASGPSTGESSPEPSGERSTPNAADGTDTPAANGQRAGAPAPTPDNSPGVHPVPSLDAEVLWRPRATEPSDRAPRRAQRGQPERQWGKRLSARNIATGTILGTSLWQGLTQVVHLPSGMIGSAVVVTALLGGWHEVKSRAEERSARRRTRKHNRKGEPI